MGSAATAAVGTAIRGSGVESGIVSATPGVGVPAGSPPTVTTTNGTFGSTEWTDVLAESVGERSSIEQPALRSPTPASRLSQRAACPVFGRRAFPTMSTNVVPTDPNAY